jgi:glucan biosynthesis protein
MNKIVEGATIEEWNHWSKRVSIRFNCEFDSNEMNNGRRHPQKIDEPRISTFRGISIDSSDEYENAYDSIRINFEFDSNEIDESDLQNEKHDDPRILISE